jgi:hypothetical protein
MYLDMVAILRKYIKLSGPETGTGMSKCAKKCCRIWLLQDITNMFHVCPTIYKQWKSCQKLSDLSLKWKSSLFDKSVLNTMECGLTWHWSKRSQTHASNDQQVSEGIA